jgi:hypothetical protein
MNETSKKGESAEAKRAADLVRMLLAPTDGEKLNAITLLIQFLANLKLDIHVLAMLLSNRIDGKLAESAQLNAAEMQRIYDAAYQKGFTDGSDHGRKSAIIAGPSRGVFHGSIGSGVNGYSWQEIAQHCAANKHLFHGRDFDFIESIAEQVQYREPSAPQAKWLKDLFMRRLNGRID